MKVQVVLALVVGFPVGVVKKVDKAKEEWKKFQGEWVQVSEEVNGKVVSKDHVRPAKLTFKGDQVTYDNGGMPGEGTFTLDPTKKPKRVVVTAKDPPGVKTIAIYEIDRGKLRICYSQTGGEPPKELSSKGGTDKNPVILEVFKRVNRDK